MRIPISIFAVLLCCVLCFSDQNIALLTSPRVLLVCVLLFWLRCEWCMRKRADLKAEAAASFRQECRMVKENYELSQTVMHLSEQHELLCSIRNCVLSIKRESTQRVSPLLKPVDAYKVLKAKTLFRRGSRSESSFLVGRDWPE